MSENQRRVERKINIDLAIDFLKSCNKYPMSEIIDKLTEGIKGADFKKIVDAIGSSKEMFTGTIFNAKVYDHHLSSEEIAKEYNDESNKLDELNEKLIIGTRFIEMVEGKYVESEVVSTSSNYVKLERGLEWSLV